MTGKLSLFDFDTPIDRRGTDCAKWDLFSEDVLPMWVADMDFAVAEPIRRALHERVDHAVFGYTFDDPALRQTLVQRMHDLYNWDITPESIVFMPGVITGMAATFKAHAQPGDGVLMQPPVYPPFMSTPGGQSLVNHTVPLVEETRDDGTLHYSIDFDAFEAAITPQTRIFLLCSPHNPVGRVWTREELTRMAEICLRHDVLICSDEIHCDLILGEQPHIPTASLSPEIEARTITLMAPSKTFNMPSLGCAFAIIPDADLRGKFGGALWSMGAHPSVMGLVAAQAAYAESGAWLSALLDYLRDNRDLVTRFVQEHLPGIRTTMPEGTYLSWLDCRALPEPAGDGSGWVAAGMDPDTARMMASNIDAFFLENAQIAFNRGERFGPQGKGFIRLNFATPRAALQDALERMRTAIEHTPATG